MLWLHWTPPSSKSYVWTFPHCLFGAVSQSYLRPCFSGCSPHFAPNKHNSPKEKKRKEQNTQWVKVLWTQNNCTVNIISLSRCKWNLEKFRHYLNQENKVCMFIVVTMKLASTKCLSMHTYTPWAVIHPKGHSFPCVLFLLNNMNLIMKKH